MLLSLNLPVFVVKSLKNNPFYMSNDFYGSGKNISLSTSALQGFNKASTSALQELQGQSARHTLILTVCNGQLQTSFICTNTYICEHRSSGQDATLTHTDQTYGGC